MKYLGSKRRIAGNIVPILKKARGKRPFVEPFCGGANLTIYIDGERYCNDLNEYVVACLKKISEGWKPPEYISEAFYKKVKNEVKKGIINYPPEVIGYLGVFCSFGALWFKSFARQERGVSDPIVKGRDNLLKEARYLKNIKWSSVDYREMKFPEKSLIYCDPPYKGTAEYKDTGFDHEEFYKWCRQKKKEGHIVFVSEFEAPFKSVWEINWNCGVGICSQRKSNKFKIRTEKLFKV